MTSAWQLDFWMAATGVLVNVTCGVLGCFLVLRRMSLLGDAISHAVLPGIALAFILGGTITGWPVFVGAMCLGLLTCFLTESLHTFGRAPEDASMGVVFSSLFALGVILISRNAANVDIDPGCIYYGAIEHIFNDTVGRFEIPRATLTLAGTLVVVIAFLVIFWKELKVASFDPGLAKALGMRPVLMHYLLMAVVAGVTVSSFEAVGSILVVAMLIVPGATAHLLTDKLEVMVWLAAGVGAIAGVGGYFLADRLNTNAAGMMAVTVGAEFFLAVLFAPRRGLVSKWLARARLAMRIASEDLIAILYRREEVAAGKAALRAAEFEAAVTSPTFRQWMAMRRLIATDYVDKRGGEITLTERGRARGQELVRAHRLWEAYLRENFELPLDHLHEPAERMEHFIDDQLRAALADELKGPRFDPHGKDIPAAP